jgi:2-polyprenyl-3-methyl-5-hydroxy-6-metoxy-1,4-benzoquinol methylase
MMKRETAAELMDDPDLDRRTHFSALRGLGRVNRWTGGAALAWRPVKDLARRRSLDRLRILDVATGGADIPLQMLKYARRSGIELEIDACDVSPKAIEFAAERCHRAGEFLRLLALDVLSEDIDERYDVVMCSQFLHHLNDQQTALVLGKMRNAATHRVVTVDLARSRWNWFKVWIATRSLTRSKIVHVDGLRSIRAAYTVSEIEAIAREIGFANVEITQYWQCRFVLVGDSDAIQ